MVSRLFWVEISFAWTNQYYSNVDSNRHHYAQILSTFKAGILFVGAVSVMGEFRNCSKCSDCFIKLKIFKKRIVIFSRLVLERWYVFRKIDWVTYLEFPEFTLKQVQRLLSFSTS